MAFRDVPMGMHYPKREKHVLRKYMVQQTTDLFGRRKPEAK